MNDFGKDKSNEISIEDLKNPAEKDNSFSEASFSVDHDYGKQYEECVKRLNPLVEEKYFNVYSHSKKEKITNTISPYAQETITWATVYTRVIRKIINPFQISRGKLFLSLEELDRHIAVVLQNRDLFQNNDTSSSEPLKEKIECQERLKKESENYIPKLMAKFSYTQAEGGKEADAVFQRKMKRHASIRNGTKKPLIVSTTSKTSTQLPIRKQSASELRRANKLNNVAILDRLQIAYEGHNKTNNIQINGDNNIKVNPHLKQNSSQFPQPSSRHTMSNFSNYNQELEKHNNKNATNPSLEVVNPLITKSGLISPPNEKEAEKQKEPEKEKEKIKNSDIILEETTNNPFKKLAEFRQIPFDDNYHPSQYYKPIEKMAYRDELERYHPNKKMNYGFYVAKEHEDIFKEMFELINFQPITLDSAKSTQSELIKRGDRIASYKQMSNDLINHIMKIDQMK